MFFIGFNNQNMSQKIDDCKPARTVEISTIRIQFARSSKQAASAHAQKVGEFVTQNEACMQRYFKSSNLASFHMLALTNSLNFRIVLCRKEIVQSILAAA
jgi:hypothetical protein